MKKLTDELREEFDYILLDCPAGIEQGFKNAIAGADRAIVVTTPEVSAIRDADRIIGLLEANELQKTELIVNRLRMDMVKRGDMMSVDDVCDILAIPLLGAVPDDEHIVISTNQGEPRIVGKRLSADRLIPISAEESFGETVEILNLEEKQTVFDKLKNLFQERKGQGLLIWTADFFKRKKFRGWAKDRLLLLLVSDRANCSPDVMRLIQKRYHRVISKYGR